MIPSIVIRPDINELQELMVHAGKTMVGVAKGVGQWSGNKKTKVRLRDGRCERPERRDRRHVIFIWGMFVWYRLVLSTCLSSCARPVCFSASRC